MNMSQEHKPGHQKTSSIWYTYVGKGGAAVFAFLWILLLLFWIFGVLKWG
jgi:hypothetical protein